jgi:ribosome-associated toxin RatA of RatAB toxin-antitoxin module
MATNAVQPQKRRVRKRIWIPSMLLVMFVLFIGWLMWRGTSAETVERNPASADEGPTTQLLSQEGRTFIRTAIVVPAPPAAVWKVVTDYDSHPKFIRYIGALSSRKLDDGRVHLTGIAHSRMWGDFPFESDVTLSEKPDQGEYMAKWDEEDKAGFRVDRGSWTVKRLAGDQSLLIFTLQMEVKGYPNFLIRNILMDRVGTIVESMRDEVVKRGR